MQEHDDNTLCERDENNIYCVNPQLSTRPLEKVVKEIHTQLDRVKTGLHISAEYGDKKKLDDSIHAFEQAQKAFLYQEYARERRRVAEQQKARHIHSGKWEAVIIADDAQNTLKAEPLVEDDSDDINFSELGEEAGVDATPDTRKLLYDIQIFLQEGLSTNDDMWMTPLHKAAENGYLEAVHTLINAGAKISSRNKKGQTPLHLAAAEGCEGCAQALMMMGNFWDCYHKPEREEKGWPMYRNIIDYDGNTALHYAVLWHGAAQGAARKGGVDHKLLDILLHTHDPGEESSRLAMSKRNFDGHTPCEVAALNRRVGVLRHLVKHEDAKFKMSTLTSKEARARDRIFLIGGCIVGVFFGFWLILYFVVDKSVINTKKNNCFYAYMDQDKMGILLEPNLYLFFSVFFFKVVESIVIDQLIPACHFILFFLFAKCGFDSSKKNLGAAVNPASDKLGKTEETTLANNTINNGKQREIGRIEKLYVYCFDRDKEILHEWRIQKYQSRRYAHETYMGYHFIFQSELIFYYVQAIFALMDLGSICHEITGPSFSDFGPLQLYVAFYGRIVNSNVLSSAFSLFQLLFFSKRLVQFRLAPHIFRSTLLGYVWWVLMTFPVLVCLPPTLTHILPGLVLFFWLPLGIILPYAFLLWGYSRLYFNEEKEEEEEEEKKDQGCGAFFSCWSNRPLEGKGQAAPRDSRVSARYQRGTGSVRDFSSMSGDEALASVNDKGHINTKAELGKYHRSRLDDPQLMLYRYLYWLCLQVLARYAVTLFFQILFDYVSISIYADGQKPFGELYGDAYKTAYKLRSQMRCYTTRLGVSGVSSFFLWIRALSGGAIDRRGI